VQKYKLFKNNKHFKTIYFKICQVFKTTHNIMANFLHPIYKWYIQTQRALPWRQTTDPYKIWISETILQQTQVKQGLNYYNHLIGRFPTILCLANASEDEVLKAWQGLGYYSRARNLHQAAKSVVDRFKGKFPDSYEDIISLKGIGGYTAAAIASIAFNLPYAAVDGNVTRFISRYF
jgi:A/G-specific adenine glycosylase